MISPSESGAGRRGDVAAAAAGAVGVRRRAQQRVGTGGVEYVAELLPASGPTTAAAADVVVPAPRLVHTPTTGWALHTAAGVAATTGPDGAPGYTAVVAG